MSGGTTESYYSSMNDNNTSLKNIQDCYYLIPDENNYGPKQPNIQLPKYDSYYNKYLTPSMYGAIDRMVINRSNALLNYEYGQNIKINYSNFIVNNFFYCMVHVFN